VYGVVGAVVIVGGSLLLTWLAIALVRRYVPHQTLSRHNDVAGFVYATMGVTYAVVLAFVVIAVWESYAETSDVADQEAGSLGALYRVASGFPDPHRAAVQEAALAYAEVVVDRSWPAMEQGEDPPPEASAAVDHLYAVYLAPDLVASVNPQQYAESLDLLDEVSIARRERVLASHSGLPGILWLVLIGGAVLVVGFALLFGVESGSSQVAILSGLTLLIALLLFVVADAQHPFQGSFSVPPEGMESVLEQFGHPAAPAATPTP
jgi:Protein of unknown function (DUF4239)